MYEAFFNLSSKPFDLLPDPRFIYLSRSYKKAMTYLNYGIRERSGFILLTGEVGSGKTTLIRDLLDKNYEHVVLSKIFNTRVTSEQLLSMINDDFGLDVHGKDKITMIRDLNVFLIDQYAAGNQPILIIDEAQNLSSELLEEVRMLSNLEASSSKLMQIILVGQPELRTILAAPELRQLRQRININCHLQALSREEVEQYIGHRLEIAGNATAVHFESEAIDAVFRYSRGIPRLINIICDFLMFLAFAEEATNLTVDMVSDVIGDLDFENYHWLEGPDTDTQHSSGFSSVVDNPDLEKEMQRIFADTMRLIKSIEYDIASPLQSALNNQNTRLAAFQTAVASHMTKTNADIIDLHRILEELCNSVTKSEKGTLHEALKSVFTAFGGDKSTPRK